MSINEQIADESVKNRKNPLKIVFIVIISLIVIALAGFGIWYFTNSPDDEETITTVATTGEIATQTTTETSAAKVATEPTTEEITKIDLSEYILPYSDKELLTDKELENFTKDALLFARNEIFARHGYQFQHEELKEYFNSKTWYKETEKLPTGQEPALNEIEKQNIAKIQEYEALFYNALNYIETVYSTSYETVNYNIPNIVSIDSAYAKEINSELNELINDISEQISYGSVHIYQNDYLVALNGNVLSLMLGFVYNGGYCSYNVYNINVVSGQKVPSSEILQNKNISEQTFLTSLREMNEAYFLERYSRELSSQIPYYDEFFNKASSDEFCNMNIPVFLDDSGKLKVAIHYPSLAGPDSNNAILEFLY